jgi:hypothetical protein
MRERRSIPWRRPVPNEKRYLPCYINGGHGWNQAFEDRSFCEPFPVDAAEAEGCDFVLIETETRSYLARNGGEIAVGNHLVAVLEDGRIVLGKCVPSWDSVPAFVWSEPYEEEERASARRIRRVIGTVVRRLDD